MFETQYWITTKKKRILKSCSCYYLHVLTNTAHHVLYSKRRKLDIWTTFSIRKRRTFVNTHVYLVKLAILRFITISLHPWNIYPVPCFIASMMEPKPLNFLSYLFYEQNLLSVKVTSADFPRTWANWSCWSSRLLPYVEGSDRPSYM